MCGISLILDHEGALAAGGKLQPALEAMQKQQYHRGPDSGATLVLPWEGGALGMGSRRLQILDASQQANQPMQRLWRGRKGSLCYNGELYNFTELRNELLQLGCQFSSSSDTEVVLFALLQWGQETLPRFQGMFALAYYQEEENKPPLLLLARDRWGQKPLYYTRQKGAWLAASEIEGLLASGLVQKRLHKAQVLHYLRYKFAAIPHTFFEEIYELEPGHCLLLQPGQQVCKSTFSSTKALNAPLSAPADDAKVVAQVEELLLDSLFNHLQSDKPVGLFLSGGVDSTLMLAMLRTHAPGQVPPCFTVGFEGNSSHWGTKDLDWARKAAEQYKAYHEPLLLQAGTVLEQFRGLAARQDQPIGDGAWLLTNLLSESAGKRVKVIWSGAGADELFGGYQRHTAFASYLRHRRWLLPMLPLLKTASRLLPAGRGMPGRQQGQLLQKFSRGIGTDPYQTFLNFTSLHLLEPEQAHTQISADQDPLQWALAHDRQHFLTSDVLALNDKAGMQWGLEMRAPYLDGPLTDYLLQLPATYLMKGGRKWILNALLNKYGGKAYTQRRKEGFGLPFGAWIQQGKTEPLWQWMAQKEHPLHEILPAEVGQHLLYMHRQGKADYSQELMALALLAVWMEEKFL